MELFIAFLETASNKIKVQKFENELLSVIILIIKY